MLAPRLAAWLEAGADCALVEVTSASGSAPREAGAAMIVRANAFFGTIGGGALEFRAIEAAREMLGAGEDAAILDIALGPEIGQCCGGRTEIRIRRADADLTAELADREAAAAAARPSLLIFGAGHTGAALARAAAPLPFRVRVIDERADWLSPLAEIAETVETPLPEAEVRAARPGAAFAVMTHDHALDFMIVEAALTRGDAAYVGMIGSATKRAILAKRLGPVAEGLTCPIGAAGPRDKRPEVIALAAAAEIAEALL